jgi:hypothetical protein
MGIDAIALVRIPSAALVGGGIPSSRLMPLRDATLVFTSAPFGADPDEVALALRHLLGDTLDLHEDDRGVLVFPDVSEIRSTTYDGVIAEVGDGAMWAPILAADAVPDRWAGAPPGSLEQLVASAMVAMGGDLRTEIERAMAAGDADRLAGLQERMAAAFGGEEAMEALAVRLKEALGRTADPGDDDDEPDAGKPR